MPTDNRVVGLVWYTRENYPRILDVMEDRDVLPDTFDDWQHRAEEGRKKLFSQGFAVLKVQLDADEFVAWCRARALHVDASSRSAYANEAAADFARNRKL